MKNFNQDLAICANKIELALEKALKFESLNEPFEAPQKLINAMRYGSLDGGKRLRPFLTQKTAEIFDIDPNKSIGAGLAVEMVHCYSLIHDDLPAMDDDDLRRGKPSLHKAFDEATAILAGDNLLNLAFETLANWEGYSPLMRNRLIVELAKGAGSGGMIGGQIFDLEGENKTLNQDEISTISAMKTGALIVASIRMGAVIGGANKDELLTLSNYGKLAGQAFQLADDILDETATKEQMGKATGKDKEKGKSTLISLIGLKEAQNQLEKIVQQAIISLEDFDEKADGLRAVVKYFGERKN